MGRGSTNRLEKNDKMTSWTKRQQLWQDNTVVIWQLDNNMTRQKYEKTLKTKRHNKTKRRRDVRIKGLTINAQRRSNCSFLRSILYNIDMLATKMLNIRNFQWKHLDRKMLPILNPFLALETKWSFLWMTASTKGILKPKKLHRESSKRSGYIWSITYYKSRDILKQNQLYWEFIITAFIT